MITAILPLLLMQVGPAPTASPVSAVPPELRDRPPRTAPMLDREAAPPAIAVCLETARTDPSKAIDLAQEWIARTKGVQRATGRHCLGVAAASAGNWALAAEAFTAARGDATDGRFRARMGALGGSALLADGKAGEALRVLDAAKADGGPDAAIQGPIALDRASALVALGRLDEARAALGEARDAAPSDAQPWLLSATLARRMGDLTEAQRMVERAAEIDPRDPAIGLEAGIIAALGGRVDAARKSFESVVAATPDSPEGRSAQHYLGQLAGG
jgi:tetratricopeptide (TPR) repeat protein